MKFAIPAAAVLASALFAIALPVQGAQSPQVTRKVLLQADLPIPGYQTTTVAVEIPVGGREGRHTHPGVAVVHVQEGAITLDHEGRQTMTYRAGDTFLVDAGKVHEGINNGAVAAKAIASFVTEKAKPLTTQTP
jgi:quercetin dioxygenase-like cupin family protein